MFSHGGQRLKTLGITLERLSPDNMDPQQPASPDIAAVCLTWPDRTHATICVATTETPCPPDVILTRGRHTPRPSAESSTSLTLVSDSDLPPAIISTDTHLMLDRCKSDQAGGYEIEDGPEGLAGVLLLTAGRRTGEPHHA